MSPCFCLFLAFSFLNINRIGIDLCFLFDFGIRKDSPIEKHDKVCLKSSKSVVLFNICGCYHQKTCNCYTFVFTSGETRCNFTRLDLKPSKHLRFFNISGEATKGNGRLGTRTGTPGHQDTDRDTGKGHRRQWEALVVKDKSLFPKNRINILSPRFFRFSHFHF